MRIPIPSRRRRSANVIIMTRQVGQSSVSKLPKIKDSLVRERLAASIGWNSTLLAVPEFTWKLWNTRQTKNSAW